MEKDPEKGQLKRLEQPKDVKLSTGYIALVVEEYFKKLGMENDFNYEDSKRDILGSVHFILEYGQYITNYHCSFGPRGYHL